MSHLTKIEDKIQLLLNKAAASTFPAEALAFQEHAERLMVRHGIESLTAKIHTEAKIETDGINLKGVYREIHKLSLFQMITAMPNLTGFYTTYKDANTIKINLVGTKGDIASFQALYSSLETQCQMALKVWWEANPLRGNVQRSVVKAERKTFIFGFYTQAANRMKALYEEEGKGSELVLVNSKKRLDDWMNSTFSLGAPKDSKVTLGSAGARLAGTSAANKANLHQSKGVGKASAPAISL